MEKTTGDAETKKGDAMTRYPIITADIKCPRCDAPFSHFEGVNTPAFLCGSIAQRAYMACNYAASLRARVKELEAVVNDPEALWANWLRGTVKLPAGIGDVRKHQEHIAELENRLRAKFNKSEEDSKHYQERIQRLIEAGDALSETQTYDLIQNINWREAKEEKAS